MNGSEEESIATLIDPDLGDKRKATDMGRKGRKKKKFIRDSTHASLIDEDYNLLVDRMD